MMDKAEVVEVKNCRTPEKTRAIIFDELRRDLADWMTADRDLVWRPVIDLTQEDDEFAVRALVPGVNPEEVQVLIAPEILLIKGETHSTPEHRKLLKSVRFPRPVNPDKVHAQIRDGMLSLRVEIADAAKANLFMPMAA